MQLSVLEKNFNRQTLNWITRNIFESVTMAFERSSGFAFVLP